MHALLLVLVLSTAGGDATSSAPPRLTAAQVQSLRSVAKASHEPVVVHAWSVWCAPCLDELPRFVRLAKTSRVRFVFLNTDPAEDWGRAKRILRQRGVSLSSQFVQADLEGATVADVFVRALDAKWTGDVPFTVWQRADGVTSSNVGEISDDELRAKLAWLKAETP